jgi:D-aminopeptidase
MSMNWIVCLIYNIKHDASKKPSELPTTTTLTLPLQEQYQAGAASLLPLLATVAGAETLYIYKVKVL